MQSTRLGRSWLLKMGAFTIVLLVFGFWGLYDATILYPKRGMADASFKFKNYLVAARDAGKLTATGVKIEDPRAALDELRAKAREAGAGGTIPGDTPNAKFDRAKLAWLESLAVVWKLTPDPILVAEGKGLTGSANTGASAESPAGAAGAATSADAARMLYFETGKGTAYAEEGDQRTRVDVSLGGLLDELDKKWAKSNQTQPLAGYDLPVQWLFVIIGFGGGFYLLVLLARAASTKFRWDAAAHRLTLPGGRAIVPADLKDVDKRRWHKYYVTLLLNDGSAQTLDLYRYEPLESWVLEMERVAFPDRAIAAAAAPADVPVAASASESTQSPMS